MFKTASLFSLLSLVSAIPLEQFTKALNNIDTRALNIDEADLDNFRFFAQYAGAAYCNSDNSEGDSIVCSADGCPDVESNGATTVGSFAGSDTGIEAFVSTDDEAGVIVFSVRGSSNIRNWITNLSFGFNSCSELTSDCEAHTGFADAWGEIREGVTDAVHDAREDNPDYDVVATGHSLGGAVATLGAAYLRESEGIPVDVYSYGSPRVGNDAFAEFVTDQSGSEYRLTHGRDPVSRLPPIAFGYRHHSPEYWLNGEDSDHIDYGTGDIDVCDGIDNVSCNGGTFGLDILSHAYYLRDISACNPKGKPSGVAATAAGEDNRVDMNDDDLEEQVNEWVQEDIDYVNGS